MGKKWIINIMSLILHKIETAKKKVSKILYGGSWWGETLLHPFIIMWCPWKNYLWI